MFDILQYRPLLTGEGGDSVGDWEEGEEGEEGDEGEEGEEGEAVEEGEEGATSQPRHNLITTSSQPCHNLVTTSSQPRHNLVTTSSQPRHNLVITSSQPRHNLVNSSTHQVHKSNPNSNSNTFLLDYRSVTCKFKSKSKFLYQLVPLYERLLPSYFLLSKLPYLLFPSPTTNLQVDKDC